MIRFSSLEYVLTAGNIDPPLPVFLNSILRKYAFINHANGPCIAAVTYNNPRVYPISRGHRSNSFSQTPSAYTTTDATSRFRFHPPHVSVSTYGILQSNTHATTYRTPDPSSAEPDWRNCFICAENPTPTSLYAGKKIPYIISNSQPGYSLALKYPVQGTGQSSCWWLVPPVFQGKRCGNGSDPRRWRTFTIKSRIVLLGLNISSEQAGQAYIY